MVRKIIYDLYVCNNQAEEPIVGFEPTTPSLPWKCSTPELYRLDSVSGRSDSNRQHSPWKGDALPIELRPPVSKFRKSKNLLTETWWGEQDSNLRSLTTTDLQSAPVGHFGIPPFFFHSKNLRLKEPVAGFEPTTGGLQNRCSTPELHWLNSKFQCALMHLISLRGHIFPTNERHVS